MNYKLCREFVVGENELIIFMNLPISVVNSNRVIPLSKIQVKQRDGTVLNALTLSSLFYFFRRKLLWIRNSVKILELMKMLFI